MPMEKDNSLDQTDEKLTNKGNYLVKPWKLCLSLVWITIFTSLKTNIESRNKEGQLV